uniref:Alpha-1,3-glucosyltransferase n=1 Tax=Odontella aurita TaxID=265563 RepID=A0A7S4J087_9STRA|mmetsp:Transcript_3460/g.9020  ORF Transcript_3460/g.9020 Transcript_3460/m.9020 type:complete len:238 (+) Transcript_3460:135-848(+)
MANSAASAVAAPSQISPLSGGPDPSFSASAAVIRPSLALVVLLVPTLLRILVAYHPHSGQDNHHGSLSAYGGDYEAQRHWMELTLHLPLGEWYAYKLDYWGLDYPPLTAYVSWLCGIGSAYLVGEESVALGASEGYEDPTHKAYMRGTVLALDALVYYTAVWALAKRLAGSSAGDRLWLVFMALMQVRGGWLTQRKSSGSKRERDVWVLANDWVARIRLPIQYRKGELVRRVFCGTR